MKFASLFSIFAILSLLCFDEISALEEAILYPILNGIKSEGNNHHNYEKLKVGIPFKKVERVNTHVYELFCPLVFKAKSHQFGDRCYH